MSSTISPTLDRFVQSVNGHVPVCWNSGGDRISAQTFAGTHIEDIEVIALHLDTDHITIFPDKVLGRFDGELVLCRLNGDEGVIADKLGGVDAASNAALASGNDRAVLRTNAEDGLLDLEIGRAHV